MRELMIWISVKTFILHSNQERPCGTLISCPNIDHKRYIHIFDVYDAFGFSFHKLFKGADRLAASLKVVST